MQHKYQSFLLSCIFSLESCIFQLVLYPKCFTYSIKNYSKIQSQLPSSAHNSSYHCSILKFQGCFQIFANIDKYLPMSLIIYTEKIFWSWYISYKGDS